MATRGTIQNFTSGGKAVSGYRATGTGIQAGVKTDDGRIIKKPVPKTDAALLSGSSVRVVNPAALRTTRRFAGLGIGLVGDQRL